MKIVKLYRIKNTSGVVSVTPIQKSEYDSITYRIISDDNMILVKGNESTSVVDTDNVDEWKECEVEYNDYYDKTGIL